MASHTHAGCISAEGDAHETGTDEDDEDDDDAAGHTKAEPDGDDDEDEASELVFEVALFAP